MFSGTGLKSSLKQQPEILGYRREDTIAELPTYSSVHNSGKSGFCQVQGYFTTPVKYTFVLGYGGANRFIPAVFIGSFML